MTAIPAPFWADHVYDPTVHGLETWMNAAIWDAAADPENRPKVHVPIDPFDPGTLGVVRFRLWDTVAQTPKLDWVISTMHASQMFTQSPIAWVQQHPSEELNLNRWVDFPPNVLFRAPLPVDPGDEDRYWKAAVLLSETIGNSTLILDITPGANLIHADALLNYGYSRVYCERTPRMLVGPSMRSGGVPVEWYNWLSHMCADNHVSLVLPETEEGPDQNG